MKILVTGHRGFTGRYVQLELELAGHTVVGLGCDLLDAAALQAEVHQLQPEAVIHLAAIAFVAHGDIQQVYDVNIVGSRNLLAALAGSCPNVQSVVLASSANIYGNQSGLLSEQAVPSPVNDYAVSKLAMEYMAATWSGQLPITVARPFNYTGLGQSANFLIPKIVNHFRERKSVIELGNIDVARDFSDVRDVARCYRMLVEGAGGGVYNIASGCATSLEQILGICSELCGHAIRVVVNPNFVRSNEIKKLAGDNARLVESFAYMPNFSLKDTLSDMLLRTEQKIGCKRQ